MIENDMPIFEPNNTNYSINNYEEKINFEEETKIEKNKYK